MSWLPLGEHFLSGPCSVPGLGFVPEPLGCLAPWVPFGKFSVPLFSYLGKGIPKCLASMVAAVRFTHRNHYFRVSFCMIFIRIVVALVTYVEPVRSSSPPCEDCSLNRGAAFPLIVE